MSGSEMLSRWFINQTDTASQKWRLKGHARDPFWDWVASWAVMAETPADMGYDASAYILPPLRIHRHKAAGDIRAPAGALFASDVSATTMHDLKRQTAGDRAEMAASIVPIGEPCVIWCDTDYEADALLSRLPNALDVRGSHSAEKKEGALAAFEAGADRVIVTKPSVAGFGLNWQHCASMIFVGRSFSYEAWYQAVRRCWRFGQKKPVDCHLIVAEGEDQIGRVIARKSADHSAMKEAMRSAMIRAASRSSEARVPYNPQHNGRMPSWLSV
jgi:hypothetical protein